MIRWLVGQCGTMSFSKILWVEDKSS